MNNATLPLQIASEAFEMIFPYYCLICKRHIRATRLCTGCTPTLPKDLCAGRCQLCFAPSLSGFESSSCLACRASPLVFSQIRFLWSYHSQAQSLISVMKYRPSLFLAKYCAKQMAEHLLDFFPQPSWDLIIPIPASRSSLFNRGFNQCAILAEAIRQKLVKHGYQPRLCYSTLSHQNNNQPQASLTNEKRLKNVAKAFRIKDRTTVAERRALLIDDVATTGATSTVAAQLLLQAGAASVDLYTLARSDTWYESRRAIKLKNPCPSPSGRAKGYIFSFLDRMC